MSQSPYQIKSLWRGLQVLSLFNRETSSLSLTEIKDAADLNKTTAFRIVSTLESAGYLERNPETRRYRPGLKVLQLGFIPFILGDLLKAGAAVMLFPYLWKGHSKLVNN